MWCERRREEKSEVMRVERTAIQTIREWKGGVEVSLKKIEEG
jgi:hypothetical protein